MEELYFPIIVVVPAVLTGCGSCAGIFPRQLGPRGKGGIGPESAARPLSGPLIGSPPGDSLMPHNLRKVCRFLCPFRYRVLANHRHRFDLVGEFLQFEPDNTSKAVLRGGKGKVNHGTPLLWTAAAGHRGSSLPSVN